MSDDAASVTTRAHPSIHPRRALYDEANEEPIPAGRCRALPAYSLSSATFAIDSYTIPDTLGVAYKDREGLVRSEWYT